MASVYRDYASDRPQDVSKLSAGEIMGWYHATIATESRGLTAGGIKGLNSFPGRLYRMLANPELRDVIRWMDHGRAWKVLQPKVFAAEVLPKYNSITQYANFVRQVNSWGFCRILKGRDKDCYFHEMFLRSRPHLVGRMKKPRGKKAPKPDPDDVPDFYAMKWLPEEGVDGDAIEPPRHFLGGGGGTAGAGGTSSGGGSGSDESASSIGSHAKLPAFVGVADPATIARNAAAAAAGSSIQQMLGNAAGQQLQRQMQQQAQGQPAQGVANNQKLPMTLNIQATVNFNFNNQAQMLRQHRIPTSPAGSSSSGAESSAALSVVGSGMKGAKSQQLQQQHPQMQMQMPQQLQQQPLMQMPQQHKPQIQLPQQQQQQLQPPQQGALRAPTQVVVPAQAQPYSSGDESDASELTQEQINQFSRQNAQIMMDLQRQREQQEASSLSGSGGESDGESTLSLPSPQHHQQPTSPFIQGQSLQIGALQSVPEVDAAADADEEDNIEPLGLDERGVADDLDDTTVAAAAMEAAVAAKAEADDFIIEDLLQQAHEETGVSTSGSSSKLEHRQSSAGADSEEAFETAFGSDGDVADVLAAACEDEPTQVRQATAQAEITTMAAAATAHTPSPGLAEANMQQQQVGVSPQMSTPAAVAIQGGRQVLGAPAFTPSPGPMPANLQQQHQAGVSPQMSAPTAVTMQGGLQVPAFTPSPGPEQQQANVSPQMSGPMVALMGQGSQASAAGMQIGTGGILMPQQMSQQQMQQAQQQPNCSAAANKEQMKAQLQMMQAQLKQMQEQLDQTETPAAGVLAQLPQMPLGTTPNPTMGVPVHQQMQMQMGSATAPTMGVPTQQQLQTQAAQQLQLQPQTQMQMQPTNELDPQVLQRMQQELNHIQQQFQPQQEQAAPAPTQMDPQALQMMGQIPPQIQQQQGVQRTGHEWMYEWAPTMSERQQNVMEFGLPITLPSMSWAFGYTWFGVAMCWGIVILHTFETIITDFGPETGKFRIKTWIKPHLHHCIDTCLIGSLAIACIVAPENFGRWPYWTSFFLFCTLPPYITVSYSTMLHKAEADAAKQLRHREEEILALVEGMQRVAAKLVAIEEQLQGSASLPQKRGPKNETGLRNRHKRNSNNTEEAKHVSNALPPKERQNPSKPSKVKGYTEQCNRTEVLKTKSVQKASTFSGRTFLPIAFWGWAPALTERQLCILEFIQPVVLPLIAQKLRFSSTGSAHCWAIVLLHTIECILTDWGPGTLGWHVKNAPLSTEAHMWIDSIFMMGGLVAGMLRAPDHYGGPSRTTFWTAMALLCMQPFFLAMSYSSADYSMRTRLARTRKLEKNCNF